MKLEFYFTLFLCLMLVNCQKNTPQAAFAINQSEPCFAPCSVSFDNQSSKATGYYWDFGDGERSEVYEPTHTYKEPGNYTVTLRAENYGHGDDVFSLTLIVNEVLPDPTAAFTFSPTDCIAPCLVDFTNKSQNANRFEWNFGDGTPKDTIKNPSHSYANPGTYSVSLKAFSQDGRIAIATAQVKINAPIKLPPVAKFDVSTSTCTNSCTINFYNHSTNGPNTYLWDFDDGQTSNQTDPNHFFSTGNYKVTLTASNSAGTSTATKTITVQSSGPSSIKLNYVTIWDLDNLTWGYYDPDGYPDLFVNIYYWSDIQNDWIFEAQTYYYNDISTLPISIDADPDDCWISNLDKNHRVEVLDYDGFNDFELISSGEFIPNDHSNSNINFYYNSNGNLAYTLYLTW